jgi:hypothetical protein
MAQQHSRGGEGEAAARLPVDIGVNSQGTRPNPPDRTDSARIGGIRALQAIALDPFQSSPTPLEISKRRYTPLIFNGRKITLGDAPVETVWIRLNLFSSKKRQEKKEERQRKTVAEDTGIDDAGTEPR